MDKSLVVVLPVHNRERQLRSSVRDILDLALPMPRPLELVIVDDGSTDDTYETACELARQYPQCRVLRQSIRQGIGSALELVRNRLSAELVLVHDGVSAIDASQLQLAIQSMTSPDPAVERTGSAAESAGSRRFAAVRALHNRMEKVHRSAATFRWIQLDRPLIPRRRTSTPTTSAMPAGVAPLSMPLMTSGPSMTPGMSPTS